MSQNDQSITLHSFPRSGRRWLSFLLFDCIAEIYNLNLEGIELFDPAEPHLVFHNIDIPITFRRVHPPLSSENTIGDKGILLLRHPLDIMVSYYYYSKLRNQSFKGSLSEFIDQPAKGLSGLIKFLNSFNEKINDNNLIVVCYEDLISLPVKTLEKIVYHINPEYQKVNIPFKEIVENRLFEKMKFEELEVNPISKNSTDDQALLARHGKSGGWKTEISPDLLPHCLNTLTSSLYSEVLALMKEKKYLDLIDHSDDNKWYYLIELSPKVFTPGRAWPNITLTRTMLKGVNLENQRCLDVGSQDGFFSALIERGGASEVIAYDRFDRSKNIDVVKKAYGLNFTYLTKKSIYNLSNLWPKSEAPPFDFILFSGVMYHLAYPMLALTTLRKLIRNGGIMILESIVLVNDLEGQVFNVKGKITRDSTFLVATDTLLVYWLKILGFEIIDFAYINPKEPQGSVAQMVDNKQHALENAHNSPWVRLGLVCRAVPQMKDDQDPWLNSHFIHQTYFYDHFKGDLSSDRLALVPYESNTSSIFEYSNDKDIDLRESLINTPPLQKR